LPDTANGFAGLLSTANRIFPAAKLIVPYRVRRWLLLNVLQVHRGYIAPPSRTWLETDVMPKLPGRSYRNILFVGAAPYTWRYEEIVTKAGGRLQTIDVRASARVWGARKHAAIPVQQIDRYFPERHFDAVVINGVLGFGVNSAEEVIDTLRASSAVLRECGLLLLGWNTDASRDPMPLAEAAGFARDAAYPTRVEFQNESHVYDFLEKT
jgi:hypothetical protein